MPLSVLFERKSWLKAKFFYRKGSLYVIVSFCVQTKPAIKPFDLNFVVVLSW